MTIRGSMRARGSDSTTTHAPWPRRTAPAESAFASVPDSAWVNRERKGGCTDDREFWQRVEARNKDTAATVDRLGLAEYFAMEAYVVA